MNETGRYVEEFDASVLDPRGVITIAHNLGTSDNVVDVYYQGQLMTDRCGIYRTGPNTVVVSKKAGGWPEQDTVRIVVTAA